MTDRLKAIEGLHRLGFSIIPIGLRGKKPVVAWKAYQARQPTGEELDDRKLLFREFDDSNEA